MQRETWRCVGLVVVVMGLAAGSACSQTPSNTTPTPKDLSSRQTRVPGEYLVTLSPGVDVETIATLYGRFGIKSTRDLGHDLFLVTFIDDPGPVRLEELRGQSAQIKAIQPNFVYRPAGSGKVQ